MSIYLNKSSISIYKGMIGVNIMDASISVYKISVIENTSTILYENDSLNSVISYMTGLTITAPITIRFNTNDTHTMTGGHWNINYSNGSNLLTVKAAAGKSPTIDGQSQSGVYAVMTVGTDNFVWDGVNIINGYTSNTEDGRTIVRLSGYNLNITIKNCLIKQGYCGIRGTELITGLTINDVTFQSINQGSIRVGYQVWTNGNMYEDFDSRPDYEYDIHDLLVYNIISIDNLSGGNVSGTTEPFGGFILIKGTKNCEVRDIITTKSVNIEESYNVLLNRIVNSNVYNTGITIRGEGTDNLTISNCFIKTLSGNTDTMVYLNICRNLSLIHNSFIGINQFDTLNIARIKRILKVVGNLFSFDYNTPFSANIDTNTNGTPYSGSMITDFQVEHDNVIMDNNQYGDTLYIGNVLNGGVDALRVRVSNYGGAILSTTGYTTTYTGYGVNTSFIDTEFITITTRTDPNTSTSPAYYLGSSDTSNHGRNMISSSVDSLAVTDLRGYTRTYPTDAGAVDRDAVT